MPSDLAFSHAVERGSHIPSTCRPDLEKSPRETTGGSVTRGRYAGTHHGRTESVPRMGPKTTKVYETLRERLASGGYAPGTKFPSERTLTEELGIGRTALRQVLARLVSEGALEVR